MQAYMQCFLLVVCGFGLSTIVSANTEEGMDYLLELDIEQLLTIELVSKRSENIADAPGIVVVITKADIERFGYRNLRDILDRQTSLQIIGYNLFPHNKASVRGVATNPVDNTFLININGRPIREADVSSINHDLYELFPVSIIEKIEIIRGPGSVLYGTNAFSGAINIVTRQIPEGSALSAALTSGSFDTQKAELSGGTNQNELSLYGALKISNSNGGDFPGVIDNLGNQDNYPFGHEGGQGVLWANYRNLTVNALFSETEADNVRSLFAYPATEHRFNRRYIDVGYQIPLNQSWRVNTNITYHTHRSEFVVSPPPTSKPDVNHTTNWIGEMTAQGTLGDKLKMLLGATYSQSRSNDQLDYLSENSRLYGQLSYYWRSSTQLIAGAQYNKSDDTSSYLSPRLGLTHNFSEHWGTKLLYSSAFREASAVERFVDSPVIKGDPTLKPETIDTLDLQLFYYKGSNSFAITYFHSQQKDVIALEGAMPVQSVNRGEITYHGLELEGRYAPNTKWLFTGNAAYQTNKDNENNHDVTYSPDLMMKWGIAYDYSGKASLGLFYSYFAESTRQNESAIYQNEPANSYQLITANIRTNLGELFNLQSLNTINADLYLDNLLDEEIYFPLMRGSVVNSIPHHAGRGAYLSVRMDFL